MFCFEFLEETGGGFRKEMKWCVLRLEPNKVNIFVEEVAPKN